VENKVGLFYSFLALDFDVLHWLLFRAFSSYQKSYQPMAVGLRTTLWEDGFRQRVERKKGGFTHFKLEWIVPTFRG